MQLVGREQLPHHRGHAAGAVEAFAEETPRRLAIHQQRNVRTEALPVIERVIDAHVPRDRDHVDRAVGARAEGRRRDHRVLERRLGHDVGGPQVLVHHANDPPSGFEGHLPALTVGAWDGSAAGQRHAERLGQ